jgi:hypothetical protein
VTLPTIVTLSSSAVIIFNINLSNLHLVFPQCRISQYNDGIAGIQTPQYVCMYMYKGRTHRPLHRDPQPPVTDVLVLYIWDVIGFEVSMVMTDQTQSSLVGWFSSPACYITTHRYQRLMTSPVNNMQKLLKAVTIITISRIRRIAWCCP